MDIDKRNQIISVVLFLMIVAMGYWLYRSIVGPYELVMEQRRQEAMVQLRMSNIRDALITYKNKKDGYPKEIDSLVAFLTTDSVMLAQGTNVFKEHALGYYKPDSLLYTPRTGSGKKFHYMLNDTLRPQVYVLIDPDNVKNVIGDSVKTTLLNAASWE